ncbi:hypothetical protein ACVWWN_006284 [Mycobacterium sp. URHB0021]
MTNGDWPGPPKRHVGPNEVFFGHQSLRRPGATDTRPGNATLFDPPLNIHCTCLDGPATVRLSTRSSGSRQHRSSRRFSAGSFVRATRHLSCATAAPFEAEPRLLAAVRWSIREHGGEPPSCQVDESLDEWLNHVGAQQLPDQSPEASAGPTLLDLRLCRQVNDFQFVGNRQLSLYGSRAQATTVGDHHPAAVADVLIDDVFDVADGYH